MSRAIIHFDGSCWPNPGGVARGGWVIEFEDGRTINGHKTIAERSTNNVAEWGALLESLYEAAQNGADAVDVFGDSQHVILILNGEWRAKQGHIKAYKAAVYKVLSEMLDWSATWVPRKENAHADRLSTSGICSPLPATKGGSRRGNARHSLERSRARVRHGRHAMAASVSSLRLARNGRVVEGDPTVFGSQGAGGPGDQGGSGGLSRSGRAGNKYVHAARETPDGLESAPEKGRSKLPSENMPAQLDYCI